MDGDGARPTASGDGIHTHHSVLRRVFGHANVSFRVGMAKAYDGGPSAYGASWRGKWSARAIRRACADSGANHTELVSQLQNRFLKISLSIRIAVFLGIVLLMAAKPELLVSSTIVGAAAILGFLLSFLTWHGNRPLSSEDACVRAIKPKP